MEHCFTFGLTRYNEFVGSVMATGSQREIGEPSLNSDRVTFTLPQILLGKGWLYLFLPEL